MERILNLKTSSATEFLHDIRKTHSTFMQFTLHALLFNVAMTELRLSPLWRMPPSQSNTGDVSIMVVWVVPFFSLLWFTINWTSITEKKKEHLCTLYQNIQEICSSVYFKGGKLGFGGGSRAREVATYGGRCGDGKKVTKGPAVGEHSFSGRGGGWR